jgi:hypothetical protein
LAFGYEKLDVYRAVTDEENEKAKALLDRIVAMLTKLEQRGYAVREDAEAYGASGIDPDTDPDGNRRRPGRQPAGAGDSQ